jgi:hypothetical protein
MSAALPGEHLCIDHQGNNSHYDRLNCIICRLERENRTFREIIEEERGVSADTVLRRFVDRQMWELL